MLFLGAKQNEGADQVRDLHTAQEHLQIANNWICTELARGAPQQLQIYSTCAGAV